ncbi:uncharacterized protein LOC132038158 [Lycium ferocissimum]|uniref:uncharacterized protein LOC132038158 n=1 Tax=Lycium ferocissimum TaxID=112874 RepID=UPI0028167DC9|nr:uncharacterized protein LOC132038158 [Lycium ferocissimum]
MRLKAGKGNRTMRCLKAPIRILSKARDFYIKNLSDYSESVVYGCLIGCSSAPQLSSWPNSTIFSVSSSVSSGNEDFRELMRIATNTRTTSLGNTVESELIMQQCSAKSRVRVVPLEEIP